MHNRPIAENQSKTKTGRLAAIEGMRGLAAIGIAVLHCWIVMGRPHFGFLPNELIGSLRLAVPFFFALSGFFHLRPYLRETLDGGERPAPLRFLRRRAARIVPLFWVTGLAALVILWSTTDPAKPSTAEFFAYIFMLHDWVPHGAAGVLNPPSWTLPIEMSFYVALPLIGLLLAALGRGSQRRAFAVVAGLWLAGVAYCVLFEALGLGQVWARTLMLMLPAFCTGMLAAIVLHRAPLAATSARIAFAAGVLIVALCVFLPALRPLSGMLGYRDLLPGIGFALMIAGAASHGPRLLASAPLVWLGGRSYGLYLWHFPMIMLLRNHDLWPDGQLAAVLLVIVLGLVLAEITHRLVERPAARFA